MILNHNQKAVKIHTEIKDGHLYKDPIWSLIRVYFKVQLIQKQVQK